MPIFWEEHFYVFCYNRKEKEVEVIDNLPLGEGVTIKNKYGDVLGFLVSKAIILLHFIKKFLSFIRF